MAIGAAAITAGAGIYKSIKGASEAGKARKAINQYKTQDLTNVYAGIGPSMLGADLQREELARATATNVEALRSGGTRGLIGGIGALQQVNIGASRQIVADLDLQQNRIMQLRAQDQAQIRMLQEQREREDLAGLGQQMMVGRQDLFSGIGDVAQSASAFSGMMGGAGQTGGGAGAGANKLFGTSPSGPGPQDPNRYVPTGIGLYNPYI